MTDSHQKQVRWGEKRYHSMDYDLKQTYGEKVYKITLNGGMTCPNRDGTVGRGSSTLPITQKLLKALF